MGQNETKIIHDAKFMTVCICEIRSKTLLLHAIEKKLVIRLKRMIDRITVPGWKFQLSSRNWLNTRRANNRVARERFHEWGV